MSNKRTSKSPFLKTYIINFICTPSTNTKNSINFRHSLIYFKIMVSTITKPFDDKYKHYRLCYQTNCFF